MDRDFKHGVYQRSLNMYNAVRYLFGECPSNAKSCCTILRSDRCYSLHGCDLRREDVSCVSFSDAISTGCALKSPTWAYPTTTLHGLAAMNILFLAWAYPTTTLRGLAAMTRIVMSVEFWFMQISKGSLTTTRGRSELGETVF